MEEILEKARELGALIAADTRFLALAEARRRVLEDADAKRLNEELAAQSEKIYRLEMMTQPVEPEDKRKLQSLRDAVHANGPLQALAEAQANYAALMAMVNRAIREQLGESTDGNA